MTTERGARCPRCSRYAGPGASFCPHCGTSLGGASHPRDDAPQPPIHEVFLVPPRTSRVHQVLRLLFTIWLVAYPVISCGPVLLGASSGGSAGGAAALGGVLVGGLFLVPWLVGLLVLGMLTLLSS
jgi:hypothetical protein